MLSRLLSLAAAATATSLFGQDGRVVGDSVNLNSSNQDLGEDGTFVGFLRALETGRLATALRQTDNDTGTDGQLNFFRMFRFGPTAADPGCTERMPTMITGTCRIARAVSCSRSRSGWGKPEP